MATEERDGRLATIEANLTNHVKWDEEQSKRLEANGTEIKSMIRDLAADLKTSVQRLHVVREEDTEKARELAASSMTLAEKKIGAVSEIAMSAHQRIDAQKIWLLTSVIFAGIMGASALAWLYDHFVSKH